MKLKFPLKWIPAGRTAKWLEISIGIAAIVLVMLWQSGALTSGKIQPGDISIIDPVSAAKTITVQAGELPTLYKAVGTVRSRTQIDLAPRIVARIREIKVRSGDHVAKGDLLVTLDDAELQAAVRQAAEHTRQAKAALDLAATEQDRMRKLLASASVSQQAFDQSDSALQQARAVAQAAEESGLQAQAVLGYATIASPMDGVVAERFADPGDLANPGAIILRIFDPTRLMLEVPIRESLVPRMKTGERVSFHVDALATNLLGEIREIVPAVDPGSRTFLVKACIDETAGLMPGMFGMLAIPTGTRRALVLPEKFVRRIGQLEYVRAFLDGHPNQVLVRTVPATDGNVEIVSGLEAGMSVLEP